MPRRLRKLCQVLIAALTLFVATGLSHFAQDVYELASCEEKHHLDDCGADGDGCPPACPDCHCSRGGYTAPQSFDARATRILFAEDLLSLWDPVSDPPSPDVDSLFRPPRA
jgi:hypothetical protein